MMATWWQSLAPTEQVLLYLAVPATLVLLLQTLLLFLGGLAGGDADADASCDGGLADADWDAGGETADAPCDTGALHDADVYGAEHDMDPHSEVAHAASGLHLFTLRGIIAFLTLFGWSGLAFCQAGLPVPLALFLAVPVGLAGMVAIALLLREALKLQYDGTLDVRNAVGLVGAVYLTVPARRAGTGKVNVLVQSQLCEFEALSDCEIPIPTGAEVTVVAIVDGDTLLVEERKPG